MDENSNENPNTYRKAYVAKTSSGFGKGVLVPFISSIVGTTLVIGVCFGVPNIRQNILDNGSKTTSTSSSIETNTPSFKNNLEAVSLSNYSDTSISAAEKILPSIVGITVEYSVSSRIW